MSIPVALHIEDDDAAAFLFRAALQELQCAIAVFRVTDGEAGLRFLNRTGEYEHAPKPDLIVVDLNLPRVNGWEVLSAVQNDEQLKDVPAIVLTTSDREADRQRAEAAGSRRYIVKPFDFGEFVTEVEAICTDFLTPPRGEEPEV